MFTLADGSSLAYYARMLSDYLLADIPTKGIYTKVWITNAIRGAEAIMIRITEKALFLPALHFIRISPNTNTTKLIALLSEFFHPTGKDGELINGRKDTHFSQKVRNLVGSHYHTNGFHALTDCKEGYFFLTPAGRLFLNRHNDLLQFLLDNQFSYSDMISLLQSSTQAKTGTRKPKYYSENDTIQEGLSEIKTTEAKQRSKKLRDYAVGHYKSCAEDKKLHCHVCNFCFEDFYGDLGVDYIEMHHEKPLCQYPDQGLEQFLSDAVANVKPVCSNCHRMLHRSRQAEPLTINQLKTLITSNST